MKNLLQTSMMLHCWQMLPNEQSHYYSRSAVIAIEASIFSELQKETEVLGISTSYG